MSCYFQRLGELYLSGDYTEADLLAVDINEVKTQAGNKVPSEVAMPEDDKTEITGQDNDVEVTPPVMSARAEVNKTHPPGRTGNMDHAPFDHLASLIAARQAEEKEPHVEKSQQRTDGHPIRLNGTLTLRRKRVHHQASPQADACYALPEVPLTVFSVELT